MLLKRPFYGFTLAELLCAIAIGSILLLLLGNLLVENWKSYQRLQERISAENEARAMISQISRELANSCFQKEWIFDQKETTWPMDHIGLFYLLPTEAQSENGGVGDLCAVHYYMKDCVIHGKTVRCLMRGFHESIETFDAIKNDRVSSLFAEKKDKDEPIVFGVISFRANFLLYDSSGNWIEWDIQNEKKPDAVEIRLIVAGAELSARLTNSSEWSGEGESGKWFGEESQMEKNRNLYVYETLIHLNNGAK